MNLIILFIAVSQVHSFNLSSSKWDLAKTDLRFSSVQAPSNAPDIKSTWIAEITTAFGRWTSVADVTFTMDIKSLLTEDCGTTCTPGNSKNEIYWNDQNTDPTYIPSTALGVTFRRGLETRMIEADIVFNLAFDKNPDTDAFCIYDGVTQCYDFPSVATHEIGHFLGMDHSSEDSSLDADDPRKLATMYYILGRNDNHLINLTTDDKAAMTCLYPKVGESKAVTQCCLSQNPFDRPSSCGHAFSSNSSESLDVGDNAGGCGYIKNNGSGFFDNMGLLCIVTLPVFLLLIIRLSVRRMTLLIFLFFLLYSLPVNAQESSIVHKKKIKSIKNAKKTKPQKGKLKNTKTGKAAKATKAVKTAKTVENTVQKLPSEVAQPDKAATETNIDEMEKSIEKELDTGSRESQILEQMPVQETPQAIQVAPLIVDKNEKEVKKEEPKKEEYRDEDPDQRKDREEQADDIIKEYDDKEKAAMHPIYASIGYGMFFARAKDLDTILADFTNAGINGIGGVSFYSALNFEVGWENLWKNFYPCLRIGYLFSRTIGGAGPMSFGLSAIDTSVESKMYGYPLEVGVGYKFLADRRFKFGVVLLMGILIGKGDIKVIPQENSDTISESLLSFGGTGFTSDLKIVGETKIHRIIGLELSFGYKFTRISKVAIQNATGNFATQFTSGKQLMIYNSQTDSSRPFSLNLSGFEIMFNIKVNI